MWLTFFSLVVLVTVGVNLTRPLQTNAATDSTINFQARLQSNTGAIVPDGWYNIEFKLYNVASGGSAQWTEDYTWNNGSGSCTGAPGGSGDCRVQVVDGYLSVSLGSITAFPAINWDQQEYLTMNIGGTNGSGSITYDGEMSPRLAMTAVPYAFRAGQLALLTGSNTSTLGFATQTAARSILLPDENGTLCIQSSANCGFALSSGGTGYVQFAPNTVQADSSTNNTIFINKTGASGNILKLQSGGTTVATIGNTGNVLLQNQANSTTAFQIQNAGGANLLQVDTSNNVITLGGNNSGELQSWQTSANAVPSTIGANPIVANGYIYIAGIATGSATTYSAKLQPTGGTEAWNASTNLVTAVNFGSEVMVNGYAYVIGGQTSGSRIATVQYAKVNPDGTFGAWATTTSLPSARYVHASVALNGYIYVMGGNDASFNLQSTVYFAKVNADGTLGSWNTTTALPSVLAGESAVTANGYIYTVEGQTGPSTFTNAVNYAKQNSDGTLGAWNSTNSTNLPSYNHSRAAVMNGYIYTVAGQAVGNVNHSDVDYTKVNADGTVNAWTQAASSLPVASHGVGLVTANGYLYSVGGNATSTTVYYASGERIQLGGSLDLIGLSGGNLNDTSGSMGQGSLGGQLTAGNTTIVGTLDVRGQANFSQGLDVRGAFNVTGSGAFRAAQNSANIFQVQNAGGVNAINVSTVNQVANSSFESGAAGGTPEGWAAKGSGVPTTDNTQALYGSNSMKVVTTTAANDGASYNYPFLASTQYTLSLYGKVSSSSITDVVIGHQEAGSDSNCLTGQTFTTTWTRFTCTFTTGSSISGTPNVYIQKSGGTAETFFVDGVQLEQAAAATNYRESDIRLDGQITVRSSADSNTLLQVQNAAGYQLFAVNTTADAANLITNGSFEANTTGWAAKNGSGTSTLSQITTQQYIGTGSLQDVTTGASSANAGASWSGTFTNNQWYAFTLFAKLNSGTLTNFEIGYSNNNAADTSCLTAQTVVTGGWTQFSCTFQYTGTTGTSYVYFKQTDTTNRTFYIDGVKLETVAGSTSLGTPYREGGLAIQGNIVTPTTFRNTNDSTNAFQIQNAAGTSNLLIADTLDTKIGIGGLPTTSNYALTVNGGEYVTGALSLGSTSCTYKLCITTASPGLLINQTGSNNILNFQSNGTNVATITSTGAVLFQNQTNSTTAFQIQDQAGTSNLLVADTTNNTIGIGVAAATTARLLVQSGTKTVIRGNSTGSNALLELQQTGVNVVSVSSTGATSVKNSTNSTTAFQIQNAAGANLLNVDTSTTSNLVTNGDFEGAGVTGWAAKGSAGAPAQVTTQQWQGNASLSETTTAAIGDGVKYNFTFTNTQQYTLSFYLKLSSGTWTNANLQAGRADNGATDTACTLAPTTDPSTTAWTRYSCTFTAGAQSGTPYLFIKQLDATVRTFFIDGVQLQTGANATPFDPGGKLQLSGTVNSPIAFQNTNDSTTAFQIQNAAGTSNLFVADTLNGRVGIGGTPANGLLTVGTNTTAASGGVYFGTDTDLYRIAANTLATDSVLQVRNSSGIYLTTGYLDQNEATATGSTFLMSNLLGDANNRYRVYADGSTWWGSGSAALDTTLSRSGAGSLLIQGTANSATALQIQNTSNNSVFTVDTSGNQALLGKASTLTGKLAFYNSSGANTITLQGPLTNPGGNYTLTIPTLTGNDTICTVDQANCGGGPGNLVQVPASTAVNTVTPTVNSVVGLTVNGTSGTAATAVNIVQGGAASNLTLSNTAATSQSLLSITHSTSAYTGTALLLNLAVGSGSFASGNFIDLQKNNVSQFKIDNGGAVTAAGNFTFSQANPTITASTGATNLTLQAPTTGTLTLNTAGAGTVNLGTANTTTVGIGNTSAAVTIEGSNAGAIAIGNGATAHTVNIAAGSGANNATVAIGSGVTGGANTAGVTIGSANAAASTTLIQGGNGATAVQIQSAGSGTISIGNNAVANTIQIGTTSTNTGNTQAINIGNLNAAGTTNVTIGTGASATGGTTTLQSQGTLSVGNGISPTINIQGSTGGAITIGNAAGSGNITLGSSNTTQSVLIANGSGASTVSIANVQTGGSVSIGTAMTTGTITIGGTGAATGTINFGVGTANQTINLGNGASGNKLITLGATSGSSSLFLQGGTGGINLGSAGIANTIQIGNTSGAVAQTINLGNNTTASSTTNVVIGSTVGGSSVDIQGGSSGIVQFGDGTHPIVALQIHSPNDGVIIFSDNATSRASLQIGRTSADATFGIAGSSGNYSTDSSVSAGSLVIRTESASKSIVLQNGTGNGNLVINNGNTTIRPTTDGTTAFQIQNAAGTSLLTADTSNLKLTANGDVNVGTNYGSRLFSDNFESGSLSLWTGNTVGSPAVSSTSAHDGKYAAQMTATTSTAAKYAPITANNTVYARAWINPVSGSAMNIVTLADSTFNNFWNLYATGGQLCLWNVVINASEGCWGTLTLNSGWHQVELRITVATSTTGTSQVWLDGTQVFSSTNRNNGTSSVGYVGIGDDVGGRTFNEYIDDVSVDTVDPGQASSLNVSDSFHVGGTSSFGNSVLIQPASNSIAAFQVQNAAGTSALNVDTTNLTVTTRAGTDAATLGSELMTGANSFPATAGWGSISGTGQTATATHTSGTTALSPTPALAIANSTTYRISWTIGGTFVAGTSLTITMGGQTLQTYNFDTNFNSTSSGTPFSDSAYVTTSSTANLAFTPSTGFTGSVSNVSVKQVTANAHPALVVKNASGVSSLEVRASSSTSNLFVGLNAGQSNNSGTGNTAFGNLALQTNVDGNSNSAFGNGALYANVNGANNTAIGVNALSSNVSGSNNVALGSGSLVSNTIGTNNVGLGYLALQFNTVGSGNVGIGSAALELNTTGYGNIAVGQGTLQANTTGALNITSGNASLQNNTTGNNNTAHGTYALFNNQTGSQNTALGENALHLNTTGSYNLGLGYGADTLFNNLSGAAALGAGATVGASNNLSLGYSFANSSNLNVGIGTSFAPNELTVSPNTYGTNGSAGAATTISQSGTTITGSGTTFTAGMTGGTIYYSDQTTATVTFVSTTSLTSSVSKTVTAGSTYNIVYGGFNVTSNGTTLIQPTSNSTSAFKIQDASANTLFTADSSNARIIVGSGSTGTTTPTILVLDNKSSTGDPTGVEGAMYYNNANKSFRCYRNGTWTNCAINEIDRFFVLTDEFSHLSTSSTDIGDLGWTDNQIGGGGGNASALNDGSTHPGVFQIGTPSSSGVGDTLTLAPANAALQAGDILEASVRQTNTTYGVARVGVHNETTTNTQPVSGVWWEANTGVNANWRYCYGNGTTATCANSTVAVGTTYVKLEIRVTAMGSGTSAATFYITDGTTTYTNSVSSVTISASSLPPAITFYTITAGGNADLNIDYYQFSGPR